MVSRNHHDSQWATWVAAIFFVAIAALPVLLGTRSGTSPVARIPDASINGVWVPDEKNWANVDPEATPTYVIKNDTMTMQLGDEIVASYSISTDASHDPAHIDLVLDAQHLGGASAALAFLADLRTEGIYQLAGDRLVFCENIAGGARPTSFNADPQKGDVLLILKRSE